MITELENFILSTMNTLYNTLGWVGIALFLIFENAPGVPPYQELDFEVAAEVLGSTEEELTEIFRTYAPEGQPDFAAIADALVVTEEALMEALDMQGGGQPGGGGRP